MGRNRETAPATSICPPYTKIKAPWIISEENVRVSKCKSKKYCIGRHVTEHGKTPGKEEIQRLLR